MLTAFSQPPIQKEEPPPSSSGLGHSPLTAKTGVRVPLGVILHFVLVPREAAHSCKKPGFAGLFCFSCRFMLEQAEGCRAGPERVRGVLIEVSRDKREPCVNAQRGFDTRPGRRNQCRTARLEVARAGVC